MSVLTTTAMEFAWKREEEGGVTSFAFRPARPLPHIAGQHGLLTLPGVGTKAYSLASAPGDIEVLIGTRLQSGSKYKTALAALEPGQRVSLRGPIMSFTLKGAPREVVFLAQGVGITPFRSLLRHVATAVLDHRTTLIHVGQEHPYRSETSELATRAEYPTDREEFRIAVSRAVVHLPEALYYVSGAKSFLDETSAILAESGVPKKQLKKDRFLGY